MASTIALSNTINWSRPFMKRRDPAMGYTAEPALTSANTVKTAILGPPFRWRWNRSITGFITAASIQDYILTNWTAGRTASLGWMIVDTNGYCQQITTAGTLGTAQPAWNQALNGTTNDNVGGGTAVWTNRGLVGLTAQGIPGNICFIEHASIQSLATDSPASSWGPLGPKIALDLDSAPGAPRFIAAQADDNLGDITFRVQPVPDAAYPISITLQQKATLLLGPASLWSPIPDEFSFIYNWGFLAMMWLFADDPRFTVANQKFVAHLLAANQGLTETERNIFLNNWQAITGDPMARMTRQTQGEQARGV